MHVFLGAGSHAVTPSASGSNDNRCSTGALINQFVRPSASTVVARSKPPSYPQPIPLNSSSCASTIGIGARSSDDVSFKTYLYPPILLPSSTFKKGLHSKKPVREFLLLHRFLNSGQNWIKNGVISLPSKRASNFKCIAFFQFPAIKEWLW